MRVFWLGAVLGIAVGCGSEAPAAGGGELDDDEVSDDGKADSATLPLGTYRGVDVPSDGALQQFTLMTGRRALRAGVCDGEPCELGGVSYKFTRSGARRFVRFYDAGGNFIDRYIYAKTPDGWQLEDVRDYEAYGWGEAHTYAIDENTGWCWNVSHCEDQGLDPNALWTCEDEACESLGFQG